MVSSGTYRKLDTYICIITRSAAGQRDVSCFIICIYSSAFMSFKTPFWRDQGLTGKSSSTDTATSPFSWIQDYCWEPKCVSRACGCLRLVSCPECHSANVSTSVYIFRAPSDYNHEDGRPTQSTAALVAFMGGDTARAWSDKGPQVGEVTPRQVGTATTGRADACACFYRIVKRYCAGNWLCTTVPRLRTRLCPAVTLNGGL